MMNHKMRAVLISGFRLQCEDLDYFTVVSACIILMSDRFEEAAGLKLHIGTT